MTNGNRLNIAIVSQMLKEHKSMKIMNYIADNQLFNYQPTRKYRAKPRRTLNFIKPLRRSPLDKEREEAQRTRKLVEESDSEIQHSKFVISQRDPPMPKASLWGGVPGTFGAKFN